MTTSGRRVLGAVVVAVLILAFLGTYIGLYLVPQPNAAAATSGPNGTTLDLATVAAAEVNDAHPTWVSYYVVDSQSNNWRHDTTYVLPAHTLVHVTIYNYDSATGLRNEFLGEAEGTQGGTFMLDGKPTRAIDPTTASHVFAIPEVGLSIPLQGISASAKNPCSNAPCSLKNDHTTTSFTFMTPGKGLYRWQCFVPCGAGFIQGMGGPMQTVGYMDGFIKVV